VIEQQKLSVSAAARAFGVHRSTASDLNRYRRAGSPALTVRKRGAKPKQLLTPAQDARLLTVLREQTPDRVGLAETL